MNKVFALFFIICLFSCEEDKPKPQTEPIYTWSFSGVEGRTIYEVKTFENWLFAGSSNGIYRRNLNNASSEWESLGPVGKDVETFHLHTLNIILASAVDREMPENSRIYKTVNAGGVWEEHQGGFGGEATEPVYSFTADPVDANTLYAAGNFTIAKSVDLGDTWELINGNWGTFANGLSVVAVNPDNANDIWAGGQNAIEQGVLMHSDDGGMNFTTQLDLMPSPSTMKSIAFDPVDGSVYTGWEGGILKSTDGGDTWSTVLDTSEDNRFIFSIIVDPTDHNTVYAGGWLKEFDLPQSLILFESKDGGTSWKELEAPDTGALYGGIYDMVLVQDAFAKLMYFGLYKGGVYELKFP